jgi:hypothetical protein
MIQSDKLVIFDYSGTLSLEAATFGETERLSRALKKSGLWQLGIDSLELFWRNILRPTWEEGSTTANSYRQLMIQRVNQVLNPEQDDRLAEKINQAVTEFVGQYLGHSQVDARWEPLLSELSASSETMVVVATDHYLEITEHVMAQLKRFDLQGVSALKQEAGQLQRHIFVANSADMGYRKSNINFWRALKKGLLLESVSRIILVDDFVLNERRGNHYVVEEPDPSRRENSAALLSTVFEAPVETFSFSLRDMDGEETEAATALIQKASEFVRKHL